jgi:hypothetical protein
VLVQNADIECNDDAVVMKAGRDADGLRVNRPTENVVVRDITVRDGAAGITFGSETSGGVLAPSPIGILFKSAATRGGTVEDISIHDIDLRGVPTAFSITFNWNPSYSYPKIPAGLTGVPPHYAVLAQEVPREKGIPHLRNVRISNLKATGARNAFSVSSYPDSPLRGVSFRNIDIQARRGGEIRNAENWTFENARIRTEDGSPVVVREWRGVAGLPAR